MLEKGLSARSAATVAAGNTAAAMGSGDLAVFATPAMVALMENAAMTAVAGELPEGATTVGAWRRNHRHGRACRSRGAQADLQRRGPRR